MSGRWLSVDPLAALAPNMTPYHYCHNNPINRIDRFGLTDEEDEDEEDENIPYTETIEVVAERYKEKGYVWTGTCYYLIDDKARKVYEKMKDSRRSIVNKILEASASVVNSFNPADVLEDENIGVVIEGGQSVAEIVKQLTKFYEGKGVAVKLPNIKDFIKALAISIASDPATNLIGPDLNSIYIKGNSGVDTTFHDVGVQRTIKTIHYQLKDTTIHINFDF